MAGEIRLARIPDVYLDVFQRTAQTSFVDNFTAVELEAVARIANELTAILDAANERQRNHLVVT